jgi:hypothetical protein
MNEKLFWKYFDAVSQNVDQATYTFYTWMAIHNFAAEGGANYEVVNRDAVFWNVTLHGLQNAFFLALGRLFDEGNDVHTIEKLLGHAVANPTIFSSHAFEARRIADNRGERPAYLDDYLKGLWEPTVDDLRDIARMLRPHKTKFHAVYKDIRNKTIAHSIAVDAADVSALFSKTLIGEIDDIIYGLNDILEVVRQLYTNGRRPNERNGKYDYRERITDKTRHVLGVLLKAWENFPG